MTWTRKKKRQDNQQLHTHLCLHTPNMILYYVLTTSNTIDNKAMRKKNRQGDAQMGAEKCETAFGW